MLSDQIHVDLPAVLVLLRYVIAQTVPTAKLASTCARSAMSEGNNSLLPSSSSHDSKTASFQTTRLFSPGRLSAKLPSARSPFAFKVNMARLPIEYSALPTPDAARLCGRMCSIVHAARSWPAGRDASFCAKRRSTYAMKCLRDRRFCALVSLALGA